MSQQSQTKASNDIPPQHQSRHPGVEAEMKPQPEYIKPNYRGSDKLKGKTALITGGDSGIGRAVAVHFAREGADVAIVYLEEDQDAEKTSQLVEAEGRKCLAIRADLRRYENCEKTVKAAIDAFGKLDILVNNAAVQTEQQDVEDISPEQFEDTFRTNIFAYYYMVREALKYLKEGARIINTASVVAYRGSGHLMDYAATKGAIVAFSRSLAENLADKKILVNIVAPGPIWTPFIPSTFPPEEVDTFGEDTALKRPGQPSEVAPAYVYLASNDGDYVTGQAIHVNGGGNMTS